MGLENISIDFSKCRNNIVIIKGDNGSGKSTIFKALTPMGDNSDDLIPGKPAQKSISYVMDDESIINIIYSYPINKKGERGQTKCNIFKVMGDTTIDLNPNSNIGEAKDMINTLFDFDQNFVSLSQLSSEDRGLADKKPSERKKFINSIIESMSEYNEMYKKLVKKSSALKMSMGSINTKIASIGNREMIVNRLKVLEDTLGTLEDRRNMLLATMGALKARAEQIDSEDIISNTRELKAKIVKIEQETHGFQPNKEDSKLDERLDSYKTKLQSLSTNKAILEERYNTIQASVSDINKDIQEKEIELNYYKQDDSYDDIKSSISEAEEDIKKAKLWLNSKNLSDDITDTDYESAKACIEGINENLQCLQTNDMKIPAIVYVIEGVIDIPTHEEIDNELTALNNKLNKLYSKLGSLSSEAVSENLCIPKDCKISNKCSLAIAYMKQTKSVSDHNKVSAQIEDIKYKIQSCNEIRKDRYEFDKAVRAANYILNTYMNNKNLLAKFSIIFKTKAQISSLMESTDHLALDMRTFYDLANYRVSIRSNLMRLEELKEKEKLIKQNEKLISTTNRDLDRLREKKDKLKLTEVKEEYLQICAEYDDLSNRIDIVLRRKAYYDRWKEKEEYEKEVSKLSNLYEEAQQVTEKLSSIKVELDDVMGSKYSEVVEEIESLKHRITLYNEYVEEYKQFSEKYEVIEKVKKYTSPTTGIQTVFMGMYMNDIINTSNQLLSLMFGGEYVLHPFVINENEFRIPCSGRGLLNDDISSMSTSQICMISMIISFALLHKASSVYNIIKLDEMDGGLDTQNRVNFIILLQKMMGLLNVEQCIMISHNSELLMQNADIIMLRNSDPNLKIDGNVIFKL
jgi:DNA repair exonuclease SbcCD ATPase subunit|nr:MAG TPA: STRUCTURAL MAINTENANCE OF CHROMOSOMES PROTEIN [Caudoviricetes sp.]